MNTQKVGYELFLPAITAAVRTKEEQDKNYTQLTDSEFKSIVAITFRDSAIQFMKDSHLYRVELPIDLYEDVKRYDLVPPDGFRIESVTKVLDGKAKVPPHCTSLKDVMLTCCPKRDIPTAFYVEVALSPKRAAGKCQFDEDFVDEYYDAILANMYMRLSKQTARQWASLGATETYKRDYQNHTNDAKRRALAGGALIKMHFRRMSDGATQ